MEAIQRATSDRNGSRFFGREGQPETLRRATSDRNGSRFFGREGQHDTLGRLPVRGNQKKWTDVSYLVGRLCVKMVSDEQGRDSRPEKNATYLSAFCPPRGFQ
jgi:hypothetical protein